MPRWPTYCPCWIHAVFHIAPGYAGQQILAGQQKIYHSTNSKYNFLPIRTQKQLHLMERSLIQFSPDISVLYVLRYVV